MTTYAGAIAPQGAGAPTADIGVGTIQTDSAGNAWRQTGTGPAVWVADHGPASTPPAAGAGGATTQVQYNNAGALAGATNVTVEDGFLRIPSAVPAAAAPAGSLLVSCTTLAGREMLAVTPDQGERYMLQPALYRKRVGRWQPTGNATTVVADGITGPTVVGGTTRSVATTNLFTSSRRLGLVSAATAAAMCSARLAAAQFWRGNAAGAGGFFASWRFGCSDAATVAGARQFVGFSAATTAATNVEPNTQLNIIGIGHGSAQSTLRILHNDGAGVATEIDLGANFPANTLSQDQYELVLFAAPNSASVDYTVNRIGTAFSASGTITTDLPTATTLLAVQMWRTNNATLRAVGLDLFSFYVETEI